MQRPKVKDIADIDFTNLISTLESYLDEEENMDEDTDTLHYVFEEALKAFYGRDVFNYVNSLPNKGGED